MPGLTQIRQMVLEHAQRRRGRHDQREDHRDGDHSRQRGALLQAPWRGVGWGVHRTLAPLPGKPAARRSRHSVLSDTTTLARIAAACACLTPSSAALAEPQSPRGASAPDAARDVAPVAVVLESTVDTHRPGDTAVADAVFTLRAGERIVLLDQAGGVTTFESPGEHTLRLERADARGSAARDAMNALFDARQRPEVGGTRDRDRDACLARADREAGLDPADCDLAFQETASGLDIAFAGGDGAEAGGRVRFVLNAAFDAYVTCVIAPDTDPDALAPLALGRRHVAGTPAARVSGGVAAQAPMRGADGVALPDEPGLYTVACDALDVRAAEALEQAVAARAPISVADGVQLRRAYGTLPSVAYAEARLPVRVTTP